METQTQIRFDAPPEAPADHLTKPEGCLPTTTGPPKHRTAHLKKRKGKQNAGLPNTDALI